jgi:hypothetical protein
MSGIHWITEPDQYLEPKVAISGFGSRKPITIIQAFNRAVEIFKNEKALALKRPVNVSILLNNFIIYFYVNLSNQ